MLSFVAVSESKTSYDQNDVVLELRYGMLINLLEHGDDDSNGLRASSDDQKLTQVRMVHYEERHREQSRGRAICVRDRVSLEEEASGGLLLRKKVAEENWEVAFGVSDVVLWVLRFPM
jgi:hypothetical protein